jgi:hypothetical protein
VPAGVLVQLQAHVADHHNVHSMLTDLRPVLAARDLLRANVANGSVVERLEHEYKLEAEEAQIALDAAWAMLRYECPTFSAAPPRQ